MRKLIYILLPFLLFAACNLSKTMMVTPGKQDVSAEGGTFVLSLTITSSERTWSAKCDSSWVQLSKEQGRGDSQITVKVEANPRKAKRSAIIKIEDKESLVQVIVMQAGNTKGGNGDNGGNGEGGEGGETDDTPAFVVKGKKIVFAPGNLQYNAAKNEWRFAENQWDYINYDNVNISPTYDGWIDLFGWGTSGYSGCNPYLTSLVDSDYGPSGERDLEGSEVFYDWGIYNRSKISNNPDRNYLWRVLSSVEWMDLKVHYQYTLANIEDWPGLLFFANEEDAKEFELSETDFYAVTIEKEWLESHTAVFLPAAGMREGSNFNREVMGEYHTSTCHPDDGCVFLEFKEVPADDYLGCAYTIGIPNGRHIGGSVRLVREVK